tara:strand:- start:33503 stop:37435 length:3933 start_codon:yes stop_codon:yes gene_type:complete
MGIIDNIKPDINRVDENHRFYDADTIISETETDSDGDPVKYRLKGVDAPEILKTFGLENIDVGTAGGHKANMALQQLAKNQGFTNIVKTGKKDPHGREIIDLQDAKGRSWERALITTGVLDPNRYTSNEALRSLEVAKVFDGHNYGDEWDTAANAVQSAILDETKYEKQFRQQAIDEAQLAYGGGYYAPGSVQFRNPDRDLQNKATSPFSSAWDVGLIGAQEGLFGAVELLGETTGWEWAENIGEAGIYRARQKIKNKPEIVTSYKDIDGFWGKEGVLQYIANNAAISLPYMAVSIGGAVAAPFTLGLSYLAPVSLYTGTTWNEMEGDNKNAGLAVTAGIAQAVLDRVGLSFISKGSMLTKEGRNTVVNALINSTKDIHRTITTKEAAKAFLLNASRIETAKLATDAAKFAKDQLIKRNVARVALQRTAIAAGGEGVTEILQEGIGYTAAHTANGFRDWDAGEFTDRIIDAGLAGSTLGASFSTPGTIYDYGAWADVAYRTAPDDARTRSWAGNKAKQDEQINGQMYNVQVENEKTKVETDALDADLVEDINVRTERFKEKRGKRDSAQIGRDLWRAIPGLWRGLTRQAFGNMGQADKLQEDSVEARILGESLGSNLQRSTSGATYENRKHHLISILRNKLGSVDKILAKFNVNDKRSSRLEFSKKFYEAYQIAKDKADAENRSINWDTDLEGEFNQYLNEFKAFHQTLNDVGNMMHDWQAKHNPQLGRITDYLSRYKSFNKEAIENNRAGFEGALVTKLNMNPDQAKEITDAILSQDSINEVITPQDGEFSVTARSTFKPQSHRQRTLGLSDMVEFNEFMENDLFTNISNAAKSSVRYVALEEYVGSDNKKINYRLNKIEQQLMQNGWSAEKAKARVDELAATLKDYFDAESGNYNRIKSPILEWAQKNLLFVTTITGLPLATISNFVESALVSKGLNVKQIFGRQDGSLMQMSRVFVNEIHNTARRAYGATTNTPMPHKRDSGGAAVAKDLGFNEWEVGAAHTTGVSETGHWRQRILDMYFKTILLQQWTNATRASRAAIAGDYVTDKLSILAEARDTNLFTNEAAEAEESLRNLGIDPTFMTSYIVGFKDADGNTRASTQEEKAKFDMFMRDASFNFVNEAVALPQAANRPKIFQDPRFALFTQFQGFISVFTANHIPKMWGELARRGTPAMKYNVFATMSTMILLGFVSQHLKDLLKYGKTTPYFKDIDYIRRGVGASGLLGTGERLIDFVFPMYEHRYKTTFGWAFGTISGESAALSKAVRIGGLGVDVIAGDKTLGYAALRVSPMAQAAHQMTKDLPQWSFGGN